MGMEQIKPAQNFNQENTPPLKKEAPVSTRQKPRLIQREEERAKKSIEEGKIEGFFDILEENGLKVSSQVELAMHYTKELEESIRIIAWTKERLMYTTAILEYTLNGENKNITSAENLIQNYLIFNRIFEEKEKKLPRFGQFAYVMRGIFNGITTKEEIYERISKHKTFGEGVTLNPLEIDSLMKKVEETSKEIRQKFIESQEKKKILDKALSDAGKEEEQEKGSTWTTSYSEPQDYFFPNYTFQTGSLKGFNHAPGRSSWEPMFLAYADAFNKKMEDRIASRTDLNEEEKNERIKKYRIELLYEPFDFPVDIKMNADGTEKPIVYRLDFIDINRWKAIEVKGPLTKKGADKIRLFKKYYVDGDFSELPEDKKMIMMSYVQNKYTDITRWCEKKGYPVFDHFSSLSVLGAYKWDYELNNFNRYTGAKDMTGLSERTKERLQKGFIKLVEDRIKSGRTPDIRPEKYIESDKLKKIIKFNQVEAKSKNASYEVERTLSAKPYMPIAIVDSIINQAKGGLDSANLINKNVLDTLPIDQEKKNIILTTDLIIMVFSALERAINIAFSENNNGKQRFKLIMEGKQRTRINNPVKKEFFEKALEDLNLFRDYLLKNDSMKVDNEKFSPKNVTKLIKSFLEIFKKRFISDKNQFIIDKDYLDLSEKLNSKIKLSPLLSYYENLLLGKYKQLYFKRNNEIENLFWDKTITIPEIDKIINENLQNIRINKFIDSEALRTSFDFIATKTCLEEKIPRNFSTFILIANKTTRSVMGLRANNSYKFKNIIEDKFKNIEQAAKFFATKNNDVAIEKDYLEVLKRLDTGPNLNDMYDDQQSFRDYLSKKSNILASMSEIFLINELGEENYKKVDTSFNYNLQKHIKTIQAINLNNISSQIRDMRDLAI